ncbi:MAG: hypothetical protein L6Q92_13740 [Phycisphaerae bacterium]|nr:hypothetical protein [Phycisphaerae bacterium]
MSTLTKVFLVLVAVFSVALSTLTIAANGMGHRWKKSAEDWKAAALAAQSNERVLAVQNKLTHEQDLERIRKLTAENEALRQAQANAIAELEKKEIELAQLQNQTVSLNGNVTSLTEMLNVVNGQLSREQEHNRTLVARNSELERTNIDLNDRTKELTSSLAMAQAHVRALTQQIAAAEEQRRTGQPPAGTQIPGGPGIVEADVPSVRPEGAPVSTTPIRGTVTKIRQNIASISVGSADGVAPGMQFLIFRPSHGEERAKYLGTLQITRVEANSSAGTLLRTTGDIHVGDKATDEASFALSR